MLITRSVIFGEYLADDNMSDVCQRHWTALPVVHWLACNRAARLINRLVGEVGLFEMEQTNLLVDG